MAYILTLDRIERECDVKAADLVDNQILTEDEVEGLRAGRKKGIRLSTANRICDFVGCEPGLLFERKSEDIFA
ncbi:MULTISPECIES: helix-turn-helix domain-containing protein [Gordonibacter]|uniref:helix-turn-helix domain-containing protein n=1 Tax=Gordonibacter TaxID=644652 RepID=UPI001D9DCED5|nr:MULTISPECIES: helix-turn-helix domain-containing protein [Gordonibacter]MDN4510237.1 helix-turn-helix domain-containing protein [Gordonibacter sp. RACS_AR49]HJF62955.1 helix-turn-helix domain-containing protein [Gordonibacter urolithinfaciens]